MTASDLPKSFHDLNVQELYHIYEVALNSGSGSIKDIRDLIIEKYIALHIESRPYCLGDFERSDSEIIRLIEELYDEVQEEVDVVDEEEQQIFWDQQKIDIIYKAINKAREKIGN